MHPDHATETDPDADDVARDATPLEATPLEADEADAAEQAAEIPEEDEYDA